MSGFRSAEMALRQAQLTGDVATLDRVLDDQLVFTGPDGLIYGKRDDLDAHTAGLIRITKLEPGEERGCSVISRRFSIYFVVQLWLPRSDVLPVRPQSQTWLRNRMRRILSPALALLLTACAQQSRPPAQAQPIREEPSRRIRLVERGTPAAAGTRLLIQFNDEEPVVHVADGNYGPPILYHGRPLHPDQIKSIRVLKRFEARERFPDQNVEAAVLIELK